VITIVQPGNITSSSVVPYVHRSADSELDRSSQGSFTGQIGMSRHTSCKHAVRYGLGAVNTWEQTRRPPGNEYSLPRLIQCQSWWEAASARPIVRPCEMPCKDSMVHPLFVDTKINLLPVLGFHDIINVEVNGF